ncbi:hypothetical protein [Acinetobacter sp. A2]|uniref:hypothetical protein n=1 Tax=Acinetobacter sp. A2 TaxID=362457 RepID=UPI0014454B2F|nr:hypothetical protein [Acinetobacter sp. A2]
MNTTPKVLVQDWWKDTQQSEIVKREISKVLDVDLPNSYDFIMFTEKVTKIFDLVKTLAMNNDKWVS